MHNNPSVLSAGWNETSWCRTLAEAPRFGSAFRMAQKRRSPGIFLILAGALAVGSAGCRKTPAGAPGADQEVARVGDHRITVAEYQAKMDEQAPVIRARYSTLEKKKEFVDNLVRFELLDQEARRQGLDKDPAVKAILDKVLVQELIRRQMEAAAKATDIPESDLKAYYQSHLDEFVRPERTRLGVILLATSKTDSQAAKVRTDAAKLVADLRKAQPAASAAQFADAARARSSDTATQALGGDTGFKTRDELAKQYGQAVADAAGALKAVGDVAGPVETERGLVVLRMAGRQLGFDQPFDAVKPRIASRLQLERRSKVMDEYVASLRKSTKVEINEAVLDKVSVQPEGASQAASAKK